MKIRAITGFTAWDEGRMKVFNPGDSGDVTDALARDYIEAGKAKAVGRLQQLDHDGNGAPGGSKPKAERKKASAPSPLGEARKAYKAAFGKAAGPRWTVDQIEAKIAEKAAEASATGEPGSEAGSESAADAPPAA